MPAHPIAPVYDAASRVLILGSFPSVRSREARFYYAHPQNRFWRVLAALTKEPLPADTRAKTDLLLRRRIALWDVIASCSVRGSSDASITDAVPNDLSPILRAARIEAVFCNGGTAHSLYERLLRPRTGIEAVRLPSTSPANAAMSLERLTEIWREALAPYLEEDP